MLSLRTLALAVAGLAASSATAQSPSVANQPVPNQPTLFTDSAPVRDSRTAAWQMPKQVVVVKPNIALLRHNSACYTLRTYQFEKAAPDSDATRLSSQSTCVPVRTSGAVAVAKPR